MALAEKIFLIGLPGSGKTTLGKQLAIQLQLPFIDLDKMIERRAAKTIAEIFNKEGEEAFRQVESNELKIQINESVSFVMATGGGAPCFANNLQALKDAGTVVFLNVPAKTIGERIQAETGQRPLLKNETPDSLKDRIEFLRSQRINFYKQAHITLSGDSITVDDLMKALQK